MKKSISLKEFSTTPTVSVMLQKTGEQFKQEKPSSIRTTTVAAPQDDPKADPKAKAKKDESVLGEMEE